MVEIQQPLDLLLVDSHTPRQFGFSDAAGPKGHVQLRFGVNDSRWEADQRSGSPTRLTQVRYLHILLHEHGYRSMEGVGCVRQCIRPAVSVGVCMRDIGEQDDKAVAVAPDSGRVKQHCHFSFSIPRSFNILLNRYGPMSVPCRGSTVMRLPRYT